MLSLNFICTIYKYLSFRQILAFLSIMAGSKPYIMKNSKFSIQYSFEEFFQEKKSKTAKDQVRIILFSAFNNIFSSEIPSDSISFLTKCVATGANL